MTGNLDQLIKFRDIQVAEDVGKKAELGYFDVEFTMYGSAYWDGEMRYKISPNKEDIYYFIEEANLRDIYPSDVMAYTVKCPIPAGMKELIAQDVKLHLAKQLKKIYSKVYFDLVNDLAKRAVTDEAKKLLGQETEELEGLFAEESLRDFETLVEYCYKSKRLTKSSYEEFQQWLAEERRNMEDNSISKDIFEKTFYGLIYEEAGEIKYRINAQAGYIYEKMYAAEREGKVVFPIASRTYWYNHSYRLEDAKDDFTKVVVSRFDSKYREKLAGLRGGQSPIEKAEYHELLEKIKEQYGKEAADTLLRYGYRWGVL